jgi:hypothetical protein
MPRYGPRSFTGARSRHSTAAADGCSVHTCWAGTDIDGSRCCATSMVAIAKAVSSPLSLRRTGAAWQYKISLRWSCSTTPGKPQKIARAPKPASKKSNSMWTPALNSFRLLHHPTQKMQNSSLEALALAILNTLERLPLPLVTLGTSERRAGLHRPADLAMFRGEDERYALLGVEPSGQRDIESIESQGL